MKKFKTITIAVFIFAATPHILFAQDVITLKNANDIQALVQEIGTDEVKYKKFDNPNGQTYVIKKSEIFMIKYANGSKDVFADTPTTPAPISTSEQTDKQNSQSKNEVLYYQGGNVYDKFDNKLSKNEIRNRMRNVPEALSIYNEGLYTIRNGNVFGIIGLGCVAGGGALLLVGLLNLDADGPTAVYIGLGAIGVGIAFNIPMVVLKNAGFRKIDAAVDAYNIGINHKKVSQVSLNFGVTQSGGVGLTLNF
ncbi:MAG: hypothetical protein LBN23_05250 [Paludibacter sp.]|jgi:hypothetical protein|nr:hypothetical protein [Paludibacter sp.]